jgi:hypothetical protein
MVTDSGDVHSTGRLAVTQQACMGFFANGRSVKAFLPLVNWCSLMVSADRPVKRLHVGLLVCVCTSGLSNICWARLGTEVDSRSVAILPDNEMEHVCGYIAN